MGSNKEILLDVKRSKWIDCLKFIAIFAVAVDHTYGILYTNRNIAYISYFSVTVFVFLSGVTGFESNKRHIEEPYIVFLKQRLIKILLPYMIISLLYMYYKNAMKIILEEAIVTWISFSAITPFYFICIYLELLLISRFLYLIVIASSRMKYSGVIHALEAALFLVLSYWLVHHTYSYKMFGSANYLFGGTYLFVYFIGMIFGFYYKKVKWNPVSSLLTVLCSGIGLFFWILFMINNKFRLDEVIDSATTINPPGITLLIYSILVVLLIWSLDALFNLKKMKLAIFVENLLARVGGESLYIYMLHMFFLDFLQMERINMILEKSAFKVILYYLVIFWGSIAMGKVINYVLFEIPKKIVNKAAHK